MCAMTPMLRTLASSTAVWVATTRFLAASSIVGRPGRSLPAVMSECLVRLGHLVGVLAALHARPEAVARVEQLVHEPLRHGLLTALAGVVDEPAQRQGGAAGSPHLHRDLVRRAADPAGANLQGWLHVVQGTLQRHHRVVARLLLGSLERAVHDPLGQGALSAPQYLVDQSGHQWGAIDRIG